MSKYAQDFILEKYKHLEIENGNRFTSVVVRLEPQSAIMLKILAKMFKFPIATSLTEIIQNDLFDMVVSLDDEKLVELNERFKDRNSFDDSILSTLRDIEMLDLDLGFLGDFGKSSTKKDAE